MGASEVGEGRDGGRPVSPAYRITCRCDDGHERTLDLRDMSREDVERVAGIMDGTSPLYVPHPIPENEIMQNRCQWPVPAFLRFYRVPCGKTLACTVSADASK